MASLWKLAEELVSEYRICAIFPELVTRPDL